ncbi:MAG TPA: acetylxylan esterase [Candidatus Hydrogenedentes bacterium]|nr:acetylxylan esterase [Candidatus Hydrogenedentota bacterium]HPG65501.1 acetylxylan esterase [Candidatus Hydrogenedentota bacterium]
MSKRLRTSVVFFALVFSALLYAQDAVQLSAVTDRPEALYHVGETARFDVALKVGDSPAAEGQVECVLSNDGEDLIERATVAVAEGRASISGQLDHPGFLRCVVAFKGPDGKTYNTMAAAGYDPLEIKAGMDAPEDFDAFWAAKRAALDAVPMNPVLVPIESPEDGVACFDLQADCLGGAPVSGYFARPVGAAPKSLPAILFVHGAGVRSSELHADYAVLGMLALDINAHGIPNGKPAEFYSELDKGALSDYRQRGREDREACYFLGMYLRLMRAMDFLTAQPEWNGADLFVIGSSQGGGQAIVAAGLDMRVTAFAANVPAMCDHTGHINGWPGLVPRDADGKPDPKILEVSRYFDAVNFARRTEAEALFTVGFIDDTCRPTSVYTAYNCLRGPKRILNNPLMKHAQAPGFWDEAKVMFQRHVEEKKP